MDYKYTLFFSSAGYYTATVFKPVSESERQWILFGLNMEMTTLVSPISVGPPPDYCQSLLPDSLARPKR